METILKLFVLLVLILLASLSLLFANNYPLYGGLAFVFFLGLGYFLNRKGWIINPNDL